MEDPFPINLRLLEQESWRSSHLLKDSILQLLIKATNRSRKRRSKRFNSHRSRLLLGNLIAIGTTNLVKMSMTRENRGKIPDQNSSSNRVARRVSNKANQCLQHFSRYLQRQDSQVPPKRITFLANIMTRARRTNTKLVNNSSLKSTRATAPKQKANLSTEQENHSIIRLRTQISRLLSHKWIPSSNIPKPRSGVKMCMIEKQILGTTRARLAHIRKARVNKVWWGRSRKITIGMGRQMSFRISGFIWVPRLQIRRTLTKHLLALIRARWTSWVHHSNNKVARSILGTHLPNLPLNSHRWAEVEHLYTNQTQVRVKANLASFLNSQTPFTHFNRPMVTTA